MGMVKRIMEKYQLTITFFDYLQILTRKVTHDLSFSTIFFFVFLQMFYFFSTQMFFYISENDKNYMNNYDFNAFSSVSVNSQSVNHTSS